MKAKKAIILTEGSKKIGIGHITRCIALYHELTKRNFSVLFAINGDSSVKKIIKGKHYLLFNWLIDINKREKIISGSTCIIIDSYLAHLYDYIHIANKTKLLVSIDDFDRIIYPSGLVIKASHYQTVPQKNSTELTPRGNQSTETPIKELIGNRYQLLRREFGKTKNLKIRKNINTFFVTFGGDDIRGLTPKILNFLVKNYPEQRKIIIIGPAFTKNNISNIYSKKDYQTHIIRNASAKDMRDNMYKSDIAISAGGQTLNELARIGLPTLTIQVAENQKLHIKNWEQRGFVINAGNYQTFNLHTIHSLITKITPIKVRTKISSAGRRIIDGKGPKRIVSEIIKASIK